MPHSMATALAKLGFEIVPFITERPTGSTRVHRKALNRLRTLQKQLCVTPIRKWLDDRAPSKTRRRVIDPVTLRSIRIECQLAELERLNQLLPSLGEAFGIAPIESAHFARPSIVANAGGLPFVVLHNKTGLVIDRDEGPVAWADAIESLIDNPDHYRDLSRNALQRARDELNWDAWGHSVAKIITETIATQR